jgi:hypothetical protein
VWQEIRAIDGSINPESRRNQRKFSPNLLNRFILHGWGCPHQPPEAPRDAPRRRGD